MQLQQYLHILNPTSITQSLQCILTTLQQEYLDLKISYKYNINLLQSDIKDKEKQIQKLNKQLDKINQRCRNLQVKNNEQNTIILGLGIKIKNFKKIIKNKFNQYLDQLDFQEDIDKLLNQTQEKKKINISQYFINILESSKSSTKIQNQTPSDSSYQMYCLSWQKPNYKVQQIQQTNFDKIYAKIQSPKISRIKSLDQNRFLRQIETLNLQNLNNENKVPKKSEVEDQSNIKSIQKSPMNIHPRHIIPSKKQRKSQIENISNKKVYLPTKIENTASKWKKFSAFRDEDIKNKFILNQDLK